MQILFTCIVNEWDGIFRWLCKIILIGQQTKNVYVNQVNVQSCRTLRSTHMFGWIIILPLKPRPQSSKRNKQTDKQEKMFNYTLLEKTWESVTVCASLLFRWASRCWDDEWFIILEDSNSVSVSLRSTLTSGCDASCEIRRADLITLAIV